MKVGNINFGARIDKGTFDMLVKARTMGLKTKKMERAMKNLFPHKTIFTVPVNNQIEGKPNKGIKLMGINTDNGYVPILDYKVYEGENSVTHIGKAYKLTQETINKITERLNALRGDKRLTALPKNPIEADLTRKFGEPV